jgi:predicted regulator of Ras-like GTPase activity (Roadblock/LC7/MglB family)
LFGQPNKTTWTPVDLVLKTAVLKGMSGALIATADGLLVAGLLPPGMKGETFAAFVPQIFNRTSQYAKEMNLGELSLVTLTVNQSSCQINKAGGVFFAALGKPGETLPTDKLALVLAELARQNQK